MDKRWEKYDRKNIHGKKTAEIYMKKIPPKYTYKRDGKNIYAKKTGKMYIQKIP